MPEDKPAAVQHDLTEYDLTLRVRMRTDAHNLRKLFERDHAYGPVERLNVHREMHSAMVPVNAEACEYIDVVDVTPAEEAGETLTRGDLDAAVQNVREWAEQSNREGTIDSAFEAGMKEGAKQVRDLLDPDADLDRPEVDDA